MMDQALLKLAIASSILVIGYLLWGTCLIWKNLKTNDQLDEFEKNRIARIRIFTIYPDHVPYTLFLLAMAIALNIGNWYFPLIGGYFWAARYTKGFGLLKIENNYSIALRNTGTMIILMPMIILSVHNLYKAIGYLQ